MATVPGLAPAQTPAPRPTQQVGRLDDRAFAAALARALADNDFPLALRVLESRPDLMGDPAAIRLRAQLLATNGRPDEALAILEARLSAAPNDALARFQLAEVHFNAHRDRPAQLAYRLALAGSLDPARRTIIANRLATIRDRRNWQFTAGLSLAPDSNINSGSDVSKVQIFGLPFDLDDQARRRSGVILSTEAGLQRRFPISERSSVLAGATGALAESFGGGIDTADLSVQVLVERRSGPALAVTGGPTAQGTWLNGDLYQTSLGVEVAVERLPVGNRAWFAAARAVHVSDNLSATRTGESFSVQAGRTHYLTPSSLTQTRAFIERRDADADFESYWYGRIAQGWLLPLPWSASAYVEPYLAYRRFDGANPLFGLARRDRELGASLKLSKRDWVFHGAFPYVSVALSRNRSNIPLNTFARKRIEVGMTRQF